MQLPTRNRLLALGVGVLVLAASCSGYEVSQPADLGDGWQTATASTVGLDEALLADMVQHIEATPARKVHAVLIVKDGMLVFEEYFDGYRFDYDDPAFEGEAVSYDATTMQNLMSVTKAIMAALVGIAIDDGAIPDIDAPVLAPMSAYADLATADLEAITVRHLLTMTSGLAWNEWDVPLTDTDNDLIQLFIVDDPIAYILSRPVTHEPGTWWYYSGGDVNLLGEVFEAYTGSPVDVYSAEHLFGPLGITEWTWRNLTPEVVYTSGELYLTPRDLAKFGYLFLNDGVWNGARVLPSTWVTASIETHVSTRGMAIDGEGYGYQWFTTTYDHKGEPIEAAVRTGWGGQSVVLLPDLDTMVVLTGGDYTLQTRANDLITNYILPAIDEP